MRGADLLGEEIPQCLRGSGGAKRLVDESGSQGSKVVNAQVTLAQPCSRFRDVIALDGGNTEGERGLARGVPPGRQALRESSTSAGDSRAESAKITDFLPQVTGRRRRAALCAARLVAPLPERSPTAVPWRERPPEMAAWPAKPAATDVVAHATLKECWRPVSARSVRWKRRRIRRRDLSKNLMNFSARLFTVVPASGLEWLTPRGGPRQRAVVGAVRER